jgi:hypothetical protein
MSVAYQSGVVLDGAAVIARTEGNPEALTTVLSSRAYLVSNVNTNKVGTSLDQRYLAWDYREVLNLPVSSGDYATGTNTAAVITLSAAGAGRNHTLTGMSYGYSSAPTSGSIKIEDGSGNVVFRAPVTLAGQQTINFFPPKIGSQNTPMIITLAAGGSGVVGDINILGRRVE